MTEAMKIRNFYIPLHISALLFSICLASHGQSQKKIDSLKSVLTETIPDSARVASLRAMGEIFYPKHLDSALHYGNILNSFSDRVGHNLGKVEAMKIIGNVHFVRKDYVKSIEHYEQAITLLEGTGADINKIIPLKVGIIDAHSKNNDSKKAFEIGLPLLPVVESDIINDKNKTLIFKNLGNVYLNSGYLDSALYYYKKNGQVYGDIKKTIKDQNDNARMFLIKRDYVRALELLLPLVDIVDDEGIAQREAYRTCTLIGGVYMAIKKSNDAIFYLKKAEGYTDRDSNPVFFIRNGDRIGAIYIEQQQYDKAKATYTDALNLAMQRDIDVSRIDLLTGLGYAHYNTKGYDSALYYFQQNLTWAQEQNNNYLIAQAYSSLGETYFEMNALDKSRSMFEKAKGFFEQLDESKLRPSEVSRNYLSLYVIDTIEKRFDINTFQNHRKYFELKERSIRNEQREKIKKLELIFKDEKKDDKIKLLVMENDLQKSNALRQKNQKMALIAGSAMLLLLLMVSVNRFLVKKKAVKTISDQREAIEEKNQENELLVQEIHHRVKNNLQIILSLLNAQKFRSEGNGRAMEIIMESQNKIKSMALIHENLYNSDNFSKIATSSYFESLINHIKDSYYDADQSLEINTDIQNDEIKMTLAVPLGLIVNELITNAHKYAFEGIGNSQIIDVKFKVDKETNVYKLEVTDNGKGLPEEFNLQASQSFGLQMVNGLVSQMNGTMELEKGNGTKFIISIDNSEIDYDSYVA